MTQMDYGCKKSLDGARSPFHICYPSSPFAKPTKSTYQLDSVLYTVKIGILGIGITLRHWRCPLQVRSGLFLFFCPMGGLKGKISAVFFSPGSRREIPDVSEIKFLQWGGYVSGRRSSPLSKVLFCFAGTSIIFFRLPAVGIGNSDILRDISPIQADTTQLS